MNDLVLDYRARLERQRLEAADRRKRDLFDQSSPDNSPDARVRVWERLHQVRLPRDPAHPILPLVAQETALGLDEVLEIQRLRTVTPAGP